MVPDRPEAADPKLRLTALSRDACVAVLRRAGASRFDANALDADLASGAPVNPDGTINLVAYGAWLVREMAQREATHGD